MNILASSLEIKQAAPIAAPCATSPIDAAGAAAPDGVESALESGLCAMFPQFEPAMIQNVLLSVAGDTDEAVLVLSGMHDAAAAGGGSSNGGEKRPREKEEGTIDLTAGSDEDGETAAAAAAPPAKRVQDPEPAAAAAAAASNEPAGHLVEEVLSGTAQMGLELDRDAAIRLLKSHHCHASDAIAAAFG